MLSTFFLLKGEKQLDPHPLVKEGRREHKIKPWNSDDRVGSEQELAKKNQIGNMKKRELTEYAKKMRRSS